RRSLRELGNPFGIPTFPQPQQQQALFGYISNGSTGIARVTFLDGLTRACGLLFSEVVQLRPCALPDSNRYSFLRLTV
ncbi:MAG TPA: hypothetical protein VIX11_17405, partial [Candidatus Acidoferrum sp.]